MSLLFNMKASVRLMSALASVFILMLSPDLSASELNTALMDRERELLNSAEQKRQAVELIDMMQTLEKLIDYPDEAIDELTGNSASHQSLKRAIRALKKAREDKRQQAERKKAQQSSAGHGGDNPSHATHRRHSQVLTPMLAIAEQSNGSIQSKVIFQPPTGESISVYQGQSFNYNGGTYQLVSVRPIDDSDPQSANSKAFKISLKTPSALKHYYWPTS